MVILLHNDGVWCTEDSLQKIKDVLTTNGVGDTLTIAEKEVAFDAGIDMLVEAGSMGEKLTINNIELCEYGDDYCDMSIVNS